MVIGKRAIWLRGVGFYLLAVVFMLPILFVFYWMVTLSLKTPMEASAFPPSFFGFSVTTAGYRHVFAKHPFGQYTLNSLIVASGSTALGLIIGLPTAYSIARWKQRGLALVMLLARIIPGISYLIPWYIFFRAFNMIDTYGALIITHLILGMPIIVMIMIGFFENVSEDLEGAALIDGCSRLGFFWRVALPLVLPGIAASAIICFIFSWNNFIYAVILAGPHTRTVPVAVFDMLSYEEIHWGPLAAAATMMTLPVVTLALIVQRHIVKGLRFGGLKE